jgi:hypothetical protein
MNLTGLIIIALTMLDQRRRVRGQNRPQATNSPIGVKTDRAVN